VLEVRLLEDILVSIEPWQSFTYLGIRGQEFIEDRGVLRRNLYKSNQIRTCYHSRGQRIFYLQHQLDRSLRKEVSLKFGRACLFTSPISMAEMGYLDTAFRVVRHTVGFL
jgi:hypothetical protein